MKNGIKNGKITQFSTINQPSNEAKSIGWKRRRYAQEFMDKVMEYQNLTIKEFESIEDNIQNNKEQFTVKDLMAFRYVSGSIKSDKLLVDWVDRHVSKAQFEKDNEKEDITISKVVVEIVDSENLGKEEHL